jgi:hypothetical protein
VKYNQIEGRKADGGLYHVSRGPLATVHGCNLCNHVEVVRKGRPGVGRGYGLAEGNRARGRMIQHLKDKHQTEYAAFMALVRQ